MIKPKPSIYPRKKKKKLRERESQREKDEEREFETVKNPTMNFFFSQIWV